MTAEVIAEGYRDIIALAKIGQAIDALLLVDPCSQQDEWQDRIEFLPL